MLSLKASKAVAKNWSRRMERVKDYLSFLADAVHPLAAIQSGKAIGFFARSSSTFR